ncbi:MAG: protein translocase subunit SecF [Nanoarchaeota archaeon]|nr:protein translocase subunit SecF [Nanoarchaeota archaeon]
MEEKSSFFKRTKKTLCRVYETHYKKLLLIPLLLIVLAFIQIGVQYATTGDFVHKGISLKGGSTITLAQTLPFSSAELENRLQAAFPNREVQIRTLSTLGGEETLVIESNAQSKDEVAALLAFLQQESGLSADDYSVEIVNPALGNSFFRQALGALGAAFLLMGIAVLLYFRVLIPSLAVILAAFSDIVVTLAIFNLTGQPLSTAGIAAFLMLIGYSVDTDILLSSRVLKRTDGSVMERIYGAIRTGMTMTGTTLAAVAIGLFVRNDTVHQIMLIIFIGLFVDMIMTWIQNVGLLRLYLERKEKRKQVSS